MLPTGAAIPRLAARLLFVRIVLFALALVLAPATAAARAPDPDVAGSAAQRTVATDELPPEARHTLALIRAGGPFPYDRDGVEFRNFERLLPQRGRGYYREYTVATPGQRNRGARRIVSGRGGEFYYTDDHYRTFRRIRQ